jgi:hypothetical protein
MHRFQVGDILRFNQETRQKFQHTIGEWLQQEPLIVVRVYSDGVSVSRLDGLPFTNHWPVHDARFNDDRFELHPFLDAAAKAVRNG